MPHRLSLFATLPLLWLAGPVLAKECIEVVASGGGHTFWSAVGQGAFKAGHELGIDIYFRGPAQEGNSPAQESIVQQIWTLRCKALVLAPNARERATTVAALNARHIPTVFIDRDTGGADIAALVATNNYRAGELAANEMAKALHGRGRVLILRMLKDVTSTSERERGFQDAALRNGLDVSEAYLGVSMVGDVRVRAAEALKTHKGKIDGVFTPNESTTVGTHVVLRQLGMAGSVTHIGFDSNKELIEALRAREIYGLVLQRPFEMGYQGVRIAYEKMRGNPVLHKVVDTGVVFATRDNMTSAEVAPLLIE